jgi:hypothetical protein
LKGILLANQNVKGREGLILFHIGVFTGVDETHAFLQSKPPMFEAAACSTLFPCRNEFVFEKNISCKS